MKKDLHPTYFANAKITCACGAEYEVGSTEESIKVEICSNCHPFYTGKQKIVDTARRVEKFKERAAKKTETKVSRKSKIKKHAEKKAKRASKTKTAKE